MRHTKAANYRFHRSGSRSRLLEDWAAFILATHLLCMTPVLSAKEIEFPKHLVCSAFVSKRPTDARVASPLCSNFTVECIFVAAGLRAAVQWSETLVSQCAWREPMSMVWCGWLSGETLCGWEKKVCFQTRNAASCILNNSSGSLQTEHFSLMKMYSLSKSEFWVVRILLAHSFCVCLCDYGEIYRCVSSVYVHILQTFFSYLLFHFYAFWNTNQTSRSAGALVIILLSIYYLNCLPLTFMPLLLTYFPKLNTSLVRGVLTRNLSFRMYHRL